MLKHKRLHVPLVEDFKIRGHSVVSTLEPDAIHVFFGHTKTDSIFTKNSIHVCNLISEHWYDRLCTPAQRAFQSGVVLKTDTNYLYFVCFGGKQNDTILNETLLYVPVEGL